MEDIVGHSCGIIGVFGVPNAAKKAALGIFALQHRGQESVGIVVADRAEKDERKRIRILKRMGLAMEALAGEAMRKYKEGERSAELPGQIALAHVRYSTSGSSSPDNIQPILIRHKGVRMAVGHNGTLVNAQALRTELERKGAIFQTTTDSEVILHLLARAPGGMDLKALPACLRQLQGAYSFIFMTEDRLIGARDPHGFRPLVLGRFQPDEQLTGIEGGYVLASESCALDMIGAQFEREIQPGEVVTITAAGVRSERIVEEADVHPSYCLFEHVYFSRPDSVVFGDSVYDVRVRLGELLAEEETAEQGRCAEADVVIGVPDSGIAAAIGYARRSGIPYDLGLIRSHFVGRSFIRPEQEQREQVVRLKFNPVRAVVAGRRVVVVEDSLIRGTTFSQMAQLLQDAGAREVHLRITCPPTRHPCYYGIDFPERQKLIAARHETVAGIGREIGVTSLRYLSIKGLLSAVTRPITHYCTACWAGQYPVAPVDAMDKHQAEAGCATRAN